MDEKQHAGFIALLTETYVAMPDKNSLAAYQQKIEPLLGGISLEDRLALAGEFRQTTALGAGEYSLAGLAYYLDPPAGGS